jgi:hypothetical protein
MAKLVAIQIYGEKLPQTILPNAWTVVNVVEHLHDFGRFELNKRDLGRQRQDRISVAEDNISHELLGRHFQQSCFNWCVGWIGIVENHLVGLYVLPRRLNVDNF